MVVFTPEAEEQLTALRTHRPHVNITSGNLNAPLTCLNNQSPPLIDAARKTLNHATTPLSRHFATPQGVRLAPIVDKTAAIGIRHRRRVDPPASIHAIEHECSIDVVLVDIELGRDAVVGGLQGKLIPEQGGPVIESMAPVLPELVMEPLVCCIDARVWVSLKSADREARNALPVKLKSMP